MPATTVWSSSAALIFEFGLFPKSRAGTAGRDFSWQQLQERLQRVEFKYQSCTAGPNGGSRHRQYLCRRGAVGSQNTPDTPVRQLSAIKFHKLYDELVYVLNLALAKGGSSDKNYVNAEGKRGSYLSLPEFSAAKTSLVHTAAPSLLRFAWLAAARIYVRIAKNTGLRLSRFGQVLSRLSTSL